MKEYMLFIRKENDHNAELSPEQHIAFLKGCEAYIGKLIKEGKLKSAQPIERQGKIISGSKGVFKESPFNESKEVIGGYYHILAKDFDEAIAIAKANPEFEYHANTRIEVRPIKMQEETTGFVYPK